MELQQKTRKFSIEIFILGICLIGMVATGAQLLFYENENFRSKGTENLGSVEPSGSDVRIRGEGEHSWNPIGKEANIFNHDRVFTGANSKAAVSLDDNSKFTIQPNSLVVLSKSQDKPTIEFNKGGFVADLKKGTKIVVKFKGKETELTSQEDSTIRLNESAEGSVNLVLERGQAEIKKAESAEPEKISVNSEMQIAEPELIPIEQAHTKFSLSSPSPGEEKENNAHSIDFYWESDRTGSAKIEVSTEPDFSSNLISHETSAQKVSLQLPKAGPYFWRVIDSQNPSAKSSVSSFTLKEPLQPTLATPHREIASAIAIASPEEVPVLAQMDVTAQTQISTPPTLAEMPIKESQPTAPVTATPQPAAPQPAAASQLAEARPAEAPQELLKENVTIKSEYWFWVGTGGNYQQHRQTLPSVSGKTSFQNIQGPNFYLRSGFLGEKWGLDVSYNDTPGLMESSKTVIVTNGAYHWKTLMGQLLWRITHLLNLEIGIQHHSMPFMVLDASTSTINIKSNTLSMATVGFEKKFPVSNELRTEWSMHYQHPISSGSSDGTPFKVAPKTAFDGSIGGVYSLSPKARLGVHWYGQFHQYGFKYGAGASEFSGDQSLFYSSFELRFGYEF